MTIDFNQSYAKSLNFILNADLIRFDDFYDNIITMNIFWCNLFISSDSAINF